MEATASGPEGPAKPAKFGNENVTVEIPVVLTVRESSPDELARTNDDIGGNSNHNNKDDHRRVKDDSGKSMEANSGVVFAHLFGMKLDARNAPRLQGYGWNLGFQDHHSRSEKSIAWIISQDEWRLLFDIYVQKIHPVYGFLDIETVCQISLRRWQDVHATNAYDHILCGVAALGSLFSLTRADDRERLLVETAKELLDNTSMVRDPTFEDAQAWLLRTLYLRCHSPPHAAWMASCTTMHVIEAIGAHQEARKVSLVYSESKAPLEHTLGCQRRLFWLAKLLNSWISFEYGRSRVVLPGTSCQPPTPIEGREEDCTTDLISLFQISEILDPDTSPTPEDLESALTCVHSLSFTLDPLVLSQANLAFTLYRRLNVAIPTGISTVLLNKVMQLGFKGLTASSRATDEGSPWWHVNNVPFQFSCILLAMDTRVSLGYVRESVEVLRKVVERFKTSMAARALDTVELLVMLAKRGKEVDAAVLGDCFREHTAGPSQGQAQIGESADCAAQEAYVDTSNTTIDLHGQLAALNEAVHLMTNQTSLDWPVNMLAGAGVGSGCTNPVFNQRMQQM
ncbi:hypothetical protein N7510_006952 [Penicillium lagena]|uniref:uncharacterized protein n=1 Tax=Penicillium lagena TaxID=94218 RepID=UPI00254179AE|nr:uncharacterized protein N7510_006952 [Penicillium lagena]KAJ5610233.1 hypothetical protein N7510_006952 [Penicillium lagena]